MDRSRLRRRAATLAVLGALAASSIASGAVTPPPIGDLGTFQVTTYWFVPETSFVGTRMKAPGLTGLYREDFLYSSRGVGMEGTGTALDGQTIHWDGTTGGYWVNRAGAKTVPTRKAGVWTHGSPYWREGGWRNAQGRPTFHLTATTWSNGAGKKHLPYHDTFALGPGVPVTPWHSIATDLKVIARGSRVYVEALRDSPARGCFSADDTGGAIIGKHIDVLVPFDTKYIVPETSRVVVLAPTDLCPPPIAQHRLRPRGDGAQRARAPGARARHRPHQRGGGRALRPCRDGLGGRRDAPCGHPDRV
jgi:3D (Asp-Asp-Asp) domain-containing protein